MMKCQIKLSTCQLSTVKFNCERQNNEIKKYTLYLNLNCTQQQFMFYNMANHTEHKLAGKLTVAGKNMGKKKRLLI